MKAKIILKQRRFLGVKTWRSPMYGLSKVVQYGKWITMQKVETKKAAQEWIVGMTRGLYQRAAFYKAKMIVNQEGRILFVTSRGIP